MKNYDKWPLIKSYFENTSPIEQQINSFNQFIEEKIPKIVEETGVISCNNDVDVVLSNVEITNPQITEADRTAKYNLSPMEARLRNITYSGSIFVDIKLYRKNVLQDEKRAYIGEIPIMVKSKKCNLHGLNDKELIEKGEDPMDLGGYLIVNGSEKALITQEVLALDRILVSTTKRGKVSSQVISVKGAFKGRVRISRKKDGLLTVKFPASPRKLYLVELLNALGLNKDSVILDAFPDNKIIQNEILLNLDKIPCKDEKAALDRIGRSVAPSQTESYRLRRSQEVIDSFLLPHIGQDSQDRKAKAYYLVTMAVKAIERFYDLRKPADKDHYSNKRLELSGKLMEHLFRFAFKHFSKDLKFQTDRAITRHRKLNINTIIRPDAITERIMFAVSTGSWIGRLKGVSKYMNRDNFISPLTDLRKVKSTLNSSRELYAARDVHGTHWGRLCPIETPDGPNCGLSKNLALMAKITTDTDTKEIKNILKEQNLQL